MAGLEMVSYFFTAMPSSFYYGRYLKVSNSLRLVILVKMIGLASRQEKPGMMQIPV